MKPEEHPAYRWDCIPIPPDSVSEGAKREWKELAPVVYQMRTARGADLPAFGLMCELLADCRSLEEAIRSEGYTIQAGSGGRKSHPALQSLTAARRQAQALLDKFGLVPGSKARQADRYSEGPHKHRYG